MRFLRTSIAALLYLIAILLPQIAVGQNWPQWRGANLDSISESTNLPAEFSPSKNCLWSETLPGPAGASPIVWEDKLFLTSVNKETNGLELLCMNTNTGVLNWKKELRGESQFVRIDTANSASPSPCTDGVHVWANTGVGHLECFDMEGNEVWHVSLPERYGEFNIQFGMASTPILDEGRLYLQLIHGNMRGKGTSVGHVVCLEGATGEEVWHHVRKTDGTKENRHSYASPTIVSSENGKTLISHGSDYVIGHSMKDGSETWRCGGMNPKGEGYNEYLRFVSSPTFVDGKLLVPSAKRGALLCLKPDLSGDVTADAEARVWSLERGTPDVACPVAFGDYVYLAGEKGTMSVYRADNGEQVFRRRMFADRHRATPVFADGKIYVAGRDGTVTVLEPGEDGNVLAENKLGGQMTASPAVAGDRIYIRTWKTIYCFSLDDD